ncbi:RimK family alpha-L-glutamate ligase [Portibacter lacus]|uniref:Alpha-L-glutamate ligase n=1 Tax=Portibacter lacus TaxID=1099794 RepID=A0AA37WFZ7_9BACT|nr:RimK family alpha-L-glutamate ligase [Portibacter lacus]GLR17475.1 putative alpha-L-glutamate ligase [Portibacter lacus]
MNIIILSRNAALYSTQSLYKAAKERGHYVRVLDHMYCDLKMSNGELEVFYEDEVIGNFDIIIPRIGTTATSYGSAVVRQFQLMGLFSTLDHEALLRTRDKLCSLQILAANGIGVPDTIISNNSYMTPELIDELNSMPMIIKLISGTHGIGVLKADDPVAAETIIETFQRLKQRVLLQEFISEAKGADVRVFIVDNEIVGVMQRQAKEGEFRSNLHRGGHSFVVALSEEEIKVAKKAAKLMGLSVCGVDMLRSKRGPLILEVNASPGLEGIETTTNIDIASKIIQFAERNVKKRGNA